MVLEKEGSMCNRNRGSVKSMECQGDAEKLGNRGKNEVAVYCESKVH